MRPHCTSPAFVDALAAFVEAFTTKAARDRHVEMRERQLLAEIAWCRRDIQRLELLARHRPSVHWAVAQRVHEIRHKELELAWLGEPITTGAASRTPG